MWGANSGFKTKRIATDRIEGLWIDKMVLSFNGKEHALISCLDIYNDIDIVVERTHHCKQTHTQPRILRYKGGN